MPGVLSGVRVIDFTRIQAGPFCTVLLQELGAHVIKVEFGESGDVVKTMPPISDGADGDLFMTVNRGRRSVTLELKTREAQEVALDLIAKSDILVENFAPGVTRKLGLDYKAAKKVNARLIYCSLSGFSQEGPSANLLAFEILAQAMQRPEIITGFGSSSGSMPSIYGAGGCYYAVATVLAALNRRDRTGQGQHIDISLQDCIGAMSQVQVGGLYLLNGKMPGYGVDSIAN